MFWRHRAAYPLPQVKERGHFDRALDRAAFAVELAKGPAEIFSPLKTALASISIVYSKYQVCIDTSLRDLLLRLHLQNTLIVKDKIEVLHSRIAVLEKLFGRPASDKRETKRREGLLMYASSLCPGSMLKLS